MRRDLLKIVILIGVVVAVAGAWALTRGEVKVGPLLGQEAPDFRLEDLDGEEVHLHALRGQPVYLNFWATWCPPCRWEMPFILSLQEDNPDVSVLAINVNEPVSKAREFLEKEDLRDLRTPMDLEGDVYELFQGGGGMPVNLFLDSEGMVCFRYRGAMTREMMDAALDKAIKGC